MLVTGSSSLSLAAGTREALTGRTWSSSIRSRFRRRSGKPLRARRPTRGGPGPRAALFSLAKDDQVEHLRELATAYLFRDVLDLQEQPVRDRPAAGVPGRVGGLIPGDLVHRKSGTVIPSSPTSSSSAKGVPRPRRKVPAGVPIGAVRDDRHEELAAVRDGMRHSRTNLDRAVSYRAVAASVPSIPRPRSMSMRTSEIPASASAASRQTLRCAPSPPRTRAARASAPRRAR